jgi:TPR repeat protein
MYKYIIILFSCLLTSILSHANINELTYTFSPQVQNQKSQFQNLLNTFSSDDTATSNIDVQLKTLLDKKDETKIADYIDQKKEKFLTKLIELAKEGDTSASIALLEYALFFQEHHLFDQIDLTAIEKLSNENNAYASYLLAQFYDSSSNSEKYIAMLEKAGYQGSPLAQRVLVDEYSFRLPNEKQDIQKAEFWKNKAKTSMGDEEYQQSRCELANCDLQEFELVDSDEILRKEK